MRRLRKVLDDPKHWRERAKNMRAIATRATDAKAKAMMLGTAGGYDNIAQNMETERLTIAPGDISI